VIRRIDTKDVRTPIVIRISSRGGDLLPTLRLIRELRRRNLSVTCLVEKAGSAAALLAITCPRRLIKRDGRMMLHVVQLTLPITSISEKGEVPPHILNKGRRLQKRWETMIKRYTRLRDENLKEIMTPGAQLVFNAKGALRWGLVDEIVD